MLAELFPGQYPSDDCKLHYSDSSNSHPQLVDRHTKRVVAKARRKRIGVSGLLSKRRMVIDVAPNVVPMIDAIVFSFVVWGRLREEQASSGVTAAAAT